MRRQSPSIAKLSRPSPSRVIIRERLFRLLEQSHKTPVVWVAGPAGSGKTTLAASWLDARKLPCLWYRMDEGDADAASFFYYMGLAARKAAPRYRKPLPLLTPEYLMGVPTFTRNFFEQLYARLAPRTLPKGGSAGFILVFDSYQEAPEQSQVHELINIGLSHIPEGIQIVILSRQEPQPVFARLRASGAMRMLSWNDLRFTFEETAQFVQSRERRKTPESAIAELHRQTNGWAAGLVLYMEGPRLGIGRNAGPITALTQKESLDYFANDVFSKLDSETKDFLLSTSFLPTMTVRAAEKLSGAVNAGHILSELNRKHFFTEKHQTADITYQYHPLFREFLLSRIRKSIDTEDVLRLQKRAAGVLEEEGMIEDATHLYCEAQDWERLVPLILNHAQTLIMEGRSKTLESWIRVLPRELIDSTPWLLFWSGMCRIGSGPPEDARGEFGQAFKRFAGMNDHLGMTLSWSLISMTVHFEANDFFQLDQWIELFFEKVEKSLPSLPLEIQARAVSAIGLALHQRRPGHPHIADFIESSLSLAGKSKDADTTLHTFMSAIIYYAWVGNASRCNALVEQLRIFSLSQFPSNPYLLMARGMQASRYLWDVSSFGESDRRITEALEFGATTGLHLWDSLLYGLGACSSLTAGDLAKAGRYLEKMSLTLIPARRETHVQYHLMMGWRQFLQRNFSAALSEVETALKFNDETGYFFSRILVLHEMAQVLHALGNDRDREFLEKALDMAMLAKSAILEFGCRLARAQFVFDDGEEKDGVELLREALSLGRKHRYFTLFWWWDPAAMSGIAVKALEYGIETDYIVELIRTRNLVPEEPPIYIENWPWPVKVFTLGTFRIEKDSKAVVFTGKVQKKPLEMLKFVIAAGGRDVPADRVIDALWPDAEGDAGHSAFKTVLSRLRQLLGNDNAVQFQDGRVTLDPRVFWVDAWAFEWMAGNADSGRTGPMKESAKPAFVEKAVALYKGRFLPADKGSAWTVSLRERLRSRYLRLVCATARHWEESGDDEKAAACYRRAIDVDDLAEEFYQRKMACYQRLGRHAEAVGVYHRCRKLLAAEFGIGPSPRTEEIYQALVSKKK